MHQKGTYSFSQKEKKHVINVLGETQKAISEENPFRLKELSNQTIHTASTEQDTDSILIAIIIYSLSRIIEKKLQFDEKKCDSFCKTASYHITNAVTALKNDNMNLFEENLNNIINSINKFSSSFKVDIQNVFQRSRINKASKIYEHGISMGRTADLLGITQYELMNYAGQKEDKNSSLNKTISEKDRIKLVMDFFE